MVPFVRFIQKGGNAYVQQELWDEVIRLHIEEGRSYKSLSEEFGISAHHIGTKVRELRSEAMADEMKAKSLKDMEEIRRLQDELAEVKKENDFLKKLAAFYAKETK